MTNNEKKSCLSSNVENLRAGFDDEVRKWWTVVEYIVGNATFGGIISKCTLGGGGRRRGARQARGPRGARRATRGQPAVCLSPRFTIHRVNFPKPTALPTPTVPPLSRALCIFINGIIASE